MTTFPMWKCHLKVNARLYLEVAFNDPNHPTPIIARFDLLSEYSHAATANAPIEVQ